MLIAQYQFMTRAVHFHYISQVLSTHWIPPDSPPGRIRVEFHTLISQCRLTVTWTVSQIISQCPSAVVWTRSSSNRILLHTSATLMDNLSGLISQKQLRLDKLPQTCLTRGYSKYGLVFISHRHVSRGGILNMGWYLSHTDMSHEGVF